MRILGRNQRRESDRSPKPLTVSVGARERLVVIGGGMAAHRLVERLQASPVRSNYEITMLCEESEPPYDRVHLGRLISGAEPHSLHLHPESWYSASGLQLLLKDSAVAVDLERRLVSTASGAVLGYDRLVFATGGEAMRPPVPGSELEGVVTYRRVEDVIQIAEAARTQGRVVVCGGGLLGLEAAHALNERGCSVEVIEAAPRLLPRQLDVEGAQVLERDVRSLGLGLRVSTRVAEITRDAGALSVRLDSGEGLRADLVVFAAGIRARDELARECGLECHPAGGIRVDSGLRSSDPNVYAIGECARHDDRLYGVVAPCYSMADVLARRLAGESDLFVGAVSSARLKVPELGVTAVGESLAEGAGVRALAWVDDDSYRRVVVRNGRIVGAIGVGSEVEFPRLQEAVARGERLRRSHERRFEKEGRLWREGAQKPIAEWPDAAVLCTCTGVTCGAARLALGEGARTSGELCQATGVGSGCGSCRPLVEELVGESEGGKRETAGWRIAAFAGVGVALLAAGFATGPIPMSTSVEAGPSIDVLWRDAFWKQVSGFTLLGLCAASLVFSLRKRLSWFSLGDFKSWRVLHTALGVGTILAAGVHTGMRLGANLNRVLMLCFLGVVLLGSLSAVVTSLEHRLPAPYGGQLRRAWTWAHILAFWPMPLLVGFHVLAFYFY